MTSTYLESTVKQITRRMKGTETFWSNGAEAMLTLVIFYANSSGKMRFPSKR